MKRIEDIEKLSLEELEEVSREIRVPEGLADRLNERLLAERRTAAPAGDEVSVKRPAFQASVAALAVAAAIAAVLMLQKPSDPVDSFDDPMLAYAQVEQTFQYISQKMSGGISMVRDAEAAVSRPESIINKINGK